MQEESAQVPVDDREGFGALCQKAFCLGQRIPKIRSEAGTLDFIPLISRLDILNRLGTVENAVGHSRRRRRSVS